MTYKIFYLSQKYRNPAILLLDGMLGQMAEPAIVGQNPYSDIDNSSWILTGANGRPAREIRSLEPYQEKLNRHIFEMNKKYQQLENEAEYEEYMCEDADFIITAFGTLLQGGLQLLPRKRYKIWCI